MTNPTPEFLVKCKSILIKLNEKKIDEIRNKFQEKASEQYRFGY
jgi:hypothetical protein